RVDGGATANNLLLQFQADIFKFPVVRPNFLETTALGAAYLAGLAVGFWNSIDDLKNQWSIDRIFEPNLETSKVDALIGQWHRAVSRAKDWIED
ncbi:MAG TPA: FGGY-family carbohydrate kinase, partial [Flavobacteriaceae bacterium]|nr:FGGY-family carbohydrate kinase [Flavobacteriaceae bacterium]